MYLSFDSTNRLIQTLKLKHVKSKMSLNKKLDNYLFTEAEHYFSTQSLTMSNIFEELQWWQPHLLSHRLICCTDVKRSSRVNRIISYEYAVLSYCLKRLTSSRFFFCSSELLLWYEMKLTIMSLLVRNVYLRCLNHSGNGTGIFFKNKFTRRSVETSMQ